MKIEIVDDSRVRAKSGYTRVFIPLTPEVLDFYNNLGRVAPKSNVPQNVADHFRDIQDQDE